MAQPRDTSGSDYAQRLETLSGAVWKRWLNVQAPYRWNLRRLGLGHTLEVGCGIGRNLEHLGGNAVGVDHNTAAVQAARKRGCTAFTPNEFAASDYAHDGAFDSLLCAHVAEHMTFDQAVALLGEYTRLVRSGGKVALIAPQKAGFDSDPTHVEYMDFTRLGQLLETCDVVCERAYSFPFPRFVGRWFRYNEFVVVGRRR